jgi:hypothetical protein
VGQVFNLADGRLQTCPTRTVYNRPSRTNLGRRDAAPRGIGALLGHADVLIEMRACPRASDDDRRRRLHASSRYEDTPRERLIELSPDGLDYVCLGTFEEGEFAVQWALLSPILAAASRKLTAADIVRSWPPANPVDRASIYRWLNQAVDRGLACRDGRGRRRHPFRYWLLGQEDRWRTNPAPFLQNPPLPYGKEVSLRRSQSHHRRGHRAHSAACGPQPKVEPQRTPRTQSRDKK